MTDSTNTTDQVVEDVMRAWADNDAAAFAKHYSADASVILPGVRLRGRAEIEAAMGQAFAGQLKGSQRRHLVQEVRPLADDIAVMLTRSTTIPPDADADADADKAAAADADKAAAEAEQEPDLWPLASWVLSRTTGTWLIESYAECPAN